MKKYFFLLFTLLCFNPNSTIANSANNSFLIKLTILPSDENHHLIERKKIEKEMRYKNISYKKDYILIKNENVITVYF